MIVIFFSLVVLPIIGLLISSVIGMAGVTIMARCGVKLHWLTSGLLVAASGWFGGIATLICLYAHLAY